MTISEIIDQERVSRINLLKVDVEKSEREVLAGIRAEHWSLIDQVVMEVDDKNGTLEEIRTLLGSRGFKVTTDQEPLLKDTAIFDVFASRQMGAQGRST